MEKSNYTYLSKREQQIMDVIHQMGEASVADVQSRLDDSPAYNSVRIIMGILEKKGFLKHKKDGQRYIYFATEKIDKAKLSALEHLLTTFFEGSAPNIVSTLIKLPDSKLTEKELDELSQIIEEAKKEQKK